MSYCKASIITGTGGATIILLLIPLFTNIYIFMTLLLLLGAFIGIVLPVNYIITGATK